MVAKNHTYEIILWSVLGICVCWLAALAAQSYVPGANVLVLMEAFTTQLKSPFNLRWTASTDKAVGLSLVFYGLGVLYYYSTQDKRRIGREYGSAEWGSIRKLQKQYAEADPMKNMLFTKKAGMSFNFHKHRHNANILVVGGSGAGKTRFFVKPNVMQSNCNYVICDPAGEVLRSTGQLLKEQGYEIRVFNLVDTLKSDMFNPFSFIRDVNDVDKMVNVLIKNTTGEGAKSSEKFWVDAETLLITALVHYLRSEAIEEHQNFATLMHLLLNAQAREDNDDFVNPLDILFEDLEEREPNHIAVLVYKSYKLSPGKTTQSILISVVSRLRPFLTPEISRITSENTIDIQKMATEKVALFCVIPDDDDTYNFLVGMMYSSLFMTLYRMCKDEKSGFVTLPRHLRVIMDEWANVALPDNFERILSTCRKYNISLNIIVQNIAQIKKMFRDSWENIIGNCDTFLYLGGNELSTHEYINKLTGKETIVTNSQSQSKGMRGNASTSEQKAGRELLATNEVREMDNEYALLFMRSEKPIADRKYDIMKHPFIAKTEDGGAAPFVYAGPFPDYSYAGIAIEINESQAPLDYVLLDD